MKVPYAYEWAKTRGFFGRKRGSAVSHLLLDGGVLSVPDESASEFIGAYALGVVKAGRNKPCVVETKTPVFRMFYDLDAHTATDAAPDAFDVLKLVCDTTAACFGACSDAVCSDAVVCMTNEPKRLDNGATKFGIHVTFDHIFADSATALAVRERVLEALANVPSPFANDWSQVVDAAVFKGSGMRLPWSVKKGEDDRWYVPIAEYVNGSWTRIERPETSVSVVRSLLARSSLRYFGSSTPCELAAHAEIGSLARGGSCGSLTHASLREHADVARVVESLVSGTYRGNVTAVLVGTHAVIFRHDSKFCANVNREHTTSNTYFLLTPRGLQQCCYSRKDASPDLGCQCRDFKGDVIDVPSWMTARFFPPPPPPPMPSVGSKTNLDALLAKTRPKSDTAKKRQPIVRQHRASPMSKLLGKNLGHM
jgi:hypothetical protein